MNMTFYYAPMSTAMVTALVIEELGLTPKMIKIDIRNGDTKKPDFLKVNPNGKVPVLVHDDVAIWESAAITLYLGEQFGTDKKLYPAAGVRRAEAMKWIVWSNVTLGESAGRWARNTTEWAPAAERNAAAGEAAKREMETNLSILDKSLQGRQFLVGDTYTLADTHLNSIVDWLRYMKVDFNTYANLNGWSKRCSDRPAYKKVMAAAQ
jgi:glutathione S-transferase